MKKLIAILLAAAMLLASCTALADSQTVNLAFDDSISFNVTLPDGYTCSQTVDHGVLNALIAMSEDNVGFMLVIAPDNELCDVARFNDLTDDQKKEFAAAITADYGSPEYTLVTTGLGTEMIMVDPDSDEYDLIIMATLYDGYDVVLYVGYADGRNVPQADKDLAMQFATDLEFVRAYQ